MINGKNYDWEDVQIFLDGVPIASVTEINYSDEQEVEALYGAGSRPIAAGKGNYKASGDITLKRDAFDTLNSMARAAGRHIFDFKPLLIVVAYGAKVIDGNFTGTEHSPLSTDTIVNVIFTKRDHSTKQNDKEVAVKLEFIAEKII